VLVPSVAHTVVRRVLTRVAPSPTVPVSSGLADRRPTHLANRAAGRLAAEALMRALDLGHDR